MRKPHKIPIGSRVAIVDLVDDPIPKRITTSSYNGRTKDFQMKRNKDV